jgi:hypothetical protein
MLSAYLINESADMRRLFLILCLILSLTFTISDVPPAAANIITVDANCSLVDAVIAANTDAPSNNCPAGSGADTIVLDLKTGLTSAYAGSTGIGGGQAGLPDITTDITIQAGLATLIIVVATDIRIFNVMNGGSLTLNGLTLSGGNILGNPDAMGGGIYVDVGGTLALNGVTLQNNEAVGDPVSSGEVSGGGIYNHGTITQIVGSTIQNNRAVGNGGDTAGGGIFNNAAVGTIHQTSITSNVVTSQREYLVSMGGGVFNEGGIASITDSEITFNEIQGLDCTPTIPCDIGGPFQLIGGGIVSRGSLGAVSGVSISNNTIRGGANNKYQSLQGGGLVSWGQINLLEDCNIDNNTLVHDLEPGDIPQNVDMNGGGLLNDGDIQTIRRCSISGNVLEMTGENFFRVGVGAGALMTGTVGLMEESTVEGNIFKPEDGSGSILIASGLELVNVDLTLSNSTISNNVGGAGSVTIEETSNLTISNTTITDNTSFNGSMAGVLNMTDGGTVAFDHVTIINNITDNTPENSIDLEVWSSGTSSFSLDGGLIGNVEDCTTINGANNLTIDQAVVSQCPSVFDGTFTIGTDVDATLQDNGGSTLTHALINHAGNPAIDGNPNCGLTTDQRGFARDANCDIGAYEVQAVVPPTDTPVPPTDTSIPPSDTPVGPATLVAVADCVNEDLAVAISSGDGPFNITATGGQNTPVIGVDLGTTTIQGPEKWDNVTVTETSGDSESINLGQFKCRTDERPVPLVPAHRAHVTGTTPTFSWAGISDANNYRVFLFDDKVVANRTVDIRQNSGGPTYLTLSTPLPAKRLFWRVRGRQNRVWSLWSVRFTLFVDAVASMASPPVFTPVPTINLGPMIPPTLPPPPNAR